MAKIIVVTVGARFGQRAEVRDGKEVLHSTRIFPLGFKTQAYDAAKLWADEHHVRVEQPEGQW